MFPSKKVWFFGRSSYPSAHGWNATGSSLGPSLAFLDARTFWRDHFRSNPSNTIIHRVCFTHEKGIVGIARNKVSIRLVMCIFRFRASSPKSSHYHLNWLRRRVFWGRTKFPTRNVGVWMTLFRAVIVECYTQNHSKVHILLPIAHFQVEKSYLILAQIMKGRNMLKWCPGIHFAHDRPVGNSAAAMVGSRRSMWASKSSSPELSVTRSRDQSILFQIHRIFRMMFQPCTNDNIAFEC